MGAELLTDAARPVSATVPAQPATLYSRFVKRFLDVVLCSLLFLVTLPLMALTGLAVLFVLGPPILFRDERAGLHGSPIRVAKFRSMSQAADSSGNLLPDAARLGPFGIVLRRTSLDELPQLISVLRGDMSLIGPRPLPMRYVPRYNPRQAARLLVRPGLTGWAQVHGRNALDWPERLELDARYVEMLGRATGPLTDFWIAAVTAVQIVSQAVSGRGIAAPGAATMREFAP
jgi:lipopolysaccharide/colanic/teichoic acid biosynthesis glycosyltransferase